MSNNFFNIFGSLNKMSQEDKKLLLSHSSVKKLDKGQLMIGDYNRCGGIPFVLSGSIRLFRISENGRDLTLYKVRAGEICVLAAICAYANLEYDFTAEGLEDSRLSVLPPDSFNNLIKNSELFREFAFSSLADKLIMALKHNRIFEIPQHRRQNQKLSVHISRQRHDGKNNPRNNSKRYWLIKRGRKPQAQRA